MPSRPVRKFTYRRKIVEKEMKPYPSRLFVVTGDLNDGTESASVQAMLHPKGGGEAWSDSLQGVPKGQRNTWPADSTDTRYPPRQFDHIIYSSSRDGEMKGSMVNRFDVSAPRTSTTATTGVWIGGVVENLLTCHWIRAGRNFIVTGATGLGKSWLACARFARRLAGRDGEAEDLVQECYARALRFFGPGWLSRACATSPRRATRCTSTASRSERCSCNG